MCETMANIPVEEKSSYVLTEDMIDAAMNEQFAYQEDLESDGESSSLGDSIEMGQDSQEDCVTENIGTIDSIENSVPNPNVSTNTETVENIPSPSLPVSNNNKVSVLVIETGLDKNGSDYIANVKEVSSGIEKHSTNTPNSSFNDTKDVNNTSGDLAKTMQGGHDMHNRDSKSDLTTLKSILTDGQDKVGIIDLCDSEVDDDFDEDDDLNEAESIDDELRSVMETNLRAEIGMAVNKKPGTETNPDKTSVEKAPVSITPRISVKNIAKISSHTFSRLPQNSSVNSASYVDNHLMKTKINENQPLRNPNYPLRNPNMNPNIPISENNQSPIHISKIAVPHSTFVNNQGRTMRCIYVKSTSSLPPFIINTPTQTTASNANMKYVFTNPLKKGPAQMPAITALKNLTKNLHPQKLVFQKNTKVLTVAQKLQKSSTSQGVPSPMPQKDNHSMEALKKMFVAKVPYTPPNTFPEYHNYTCIECNDKFLFKSSLTNHSERRSISIRYWCQICKSELQFYNRCSLLVHLRGHNSSFKSIDASCISISAIPKEMLEKGIVSSFLKDSDPIRGPPLKPVTSAGSIRIDQSYTTSTPNSNTADSRPKATSAVSSFNFSNHKITTVAGQSKSVCYQTPSLSEVSKPVMSSVANSQASNKVVPLLLPKTSNQVQAVALVSNQALQNRAIEKPTSNNKSPPKSVILLCNKLPQSPNIQQNAVVNPLPPNVVCEADSNVNSSSTVTNNKDTEMIIDDDITFVPNNTEGEIVDVENIETNVSSSSSPTGTNSESNIKSSLGKRKKNPTSTEKLGPKKRNCSECKVYCPNISKHLNGNNRPSRSDLACKICNLILPTKCALNIHHRIHMKIPPHKCPDCGKDFTSWDDLHSHLKFSCGHFAKCVRYICGACKAHFPAKNGLAQHIVKSHGRDISKCSLCPVAFYKKSSLLKHIFNDHGNEKNKTQIGMDYKQCEMCPKKLLPEESFLSHAQEHSNSMIYGYKCSMCNIVYANKMAFIIHQIKEKTKKDQLGRSGDHSKPSHYEESREEAVQVSDSNSDFEDEPVIVRKYPEFNNDSIITEKDPLSLDDWECTQEQKVKEKTEELCIVCKKNSIVLLPEIDLNRQSLCCKQCVKPLDDVTSTETLRNSTGSRSSVFSPSKCNKQRRSNPKNIYRSSSTDEVKRVTKKRRISDVSHNSSPENEHLFDSLADSPSRKKSRKKPKEKFNPKGQTHIQGQVIKSRSLDELSYKCTKCDFVTDKRESFLKHITVHRTDPNTYQCLECGLCFVVLPSLERHLQMHHGIKDASSYTENNKASLPQKVSRIEEETQDNQCHVCYELFDCKLSLDKHIRIHGMAFMSRLSKPL